MKRATDRGDLRDKVAVVDPTAAPELGDAEAGGVGLRGAARGADRQQARLAQRAVPTLDPNRAVSTAEYPEKDHQGGVLARLAAAGVFVAVLVGIALWLTLPGL
jgi:hypothetical protein